MPEAPSLNYESVQRQWPTQNVTFFSSAVKINGEAQRPKRFTESNRAYWCALRVQVRARAVIYKHLSRMRAEHGHLLTDKLVHVLDIPDEYK
jgi:hypothetical protein